jgi:SP family facilitated glucose transporter-like MFS transporter 8
MVDILSKTRKDETQVMDDYYSNVLISGVRFVTILISSILMLRAGRRTLAMISGILSSLSALCLGIILSLNTTKFGSSISPQIEAHVTFALILIYAGSMSFGFFALPSIMIGETQPSHFRGFACGYIYTMNDFLLGGFLKIYPWMLTTLQIHGLFLFFGISCAVCTIFLYFFLPETQGLTLQQIEDYFLQPNVMWITRNRYKNERKETDDVGLQINSTT